MSPLQPSTVPLSAPPSARDSSFRLLAVVGLVLIGTALSVTAFLASDSVVRAAAPEEVEPPVLQYLPEPESYRTTSFIWSGDRPGASGVGLGDGASTASGLRLRRLPRSWNLGTARG